LLAVSRRTRYRQLARQHERRKAERRRHERRRQRTVVVVIVAVLLALGIGGVVVLTGGSEAPRASGPTGPTGGTGETGATGTLPNQNGTVQPEPGPQKVACGAEQPKGALDPKPQFSEPEQVVKRGTTYTAQIQTSCGVIMVELLAAEAPKTVNSFVFLAELGFFDGQRFHRIDDSIDVIQGGDPTASGTGGPGYSIPDELTGEESYAPGVLAMANSGPDTGGSQFFIVTGKDGHLLDDQGAWTIFGTIVEGLDVAKAIQLLPIEDPTAGLSGQGPAKAVYIERVEIQQSD
jgi:cyclophilin family peptidyl-prolyl cis-trans isomerase